MGQLETQVLPTAAPKPWYLSTGFITSAVLIIGGFFVGFPEDAAKATVGAIFTTISSLGIFRVWVKAGIQADWRRWLLNGNFWGLLLALAGSIDAVFAPQFVEPLRQIVESAINGNFNGVVVGIGGLLAVVLSLMRGRSKKES